jgi:3-carboxy-cis,cis-muconate cycloisomerase
VAAACAALAERHRETLMAARTLLQQAVPTTFGLKAAGWLVAVLDARSRLVDVRDRGLAAQLGGAAGTLAGFGERGPEVAALFAAELGLAQPTLPWHSHRARIAELAGAVDVAAGVASKIALDVALLAQTEVGEAAEAAGGRSSTMPQKRNPVGSALTLACARLAHANAALLGGGLDHEHERSPGAWQAEWPALTASLAYGGGALASLRGALAGLEVDAARMRENLDATSGAIMTERLSFLLVPVLGRERTKAALDSALAAAAAAPGVQLRDALLAGPELGLSEDELDAALDPAGYTGAADALVERALRRHAAELGGGR